MNDNDTLRVPVTLTLLIPIKSPVLEQSIDTNKTIDNCKIIDVSQCENLSSVVKDITDNEIVKKAMAHLMNAALDFMIRNENIKAAVTPWAGIIEETRF